MSSTDSAAARTDPLVRGGMLLIALLLIAANLRAAITPVGPLIGDIRSDLGISAVTASVLISIPLVAFGLFSPVAPLLAARLGIERTLGMALIALAIGIIARSWPGQVTLWVGTVLLGLAIALINVLLPALVKRDYPSRVGSVTGTYSAVQSGLAAIAAGVAVPIADASQHGWRISLGIWAGLALVAFAVFLPQLRRGPEPLAPQPEHDESGATNRYRSPWGAALAWQVTLFMGLQSTIYYTVITWWPAVEQAGGVSPAVAGWHQFAYQMFGLAGTVVCAATINRLSDQRLMAVVVSVFMFAGILGQLAAPALGLLWISLIGLGSGGSIVLALALLGLRTHHHGQSASLSGMAQSMGYLLAATGPIVISILHDATDAWVLPLVVLLCVVAAQVVFGVLGGRDRQLGMRPSDR
ncbi:CynX/NimT family MFS transporter [Rathayibacter sp. KR2-224]|uniref:CynX/NimT family MFS transporter n=1 Tax=Rathayibacter sp. KR2-224 TaxID=3400913 RepID=UPI003BFBA663